MAGDAPHAKPGEPVKQRSDPVACIECGRVNWSLESRCVYCRLGWPDPGDMRGLPAGGCSAGTLSLAQPTHSSPMSEAAAQSLQSRRVLREIAKDDAGRFLQDIKCIACSYNLRGMRAEDVCPECGETVQKSLWTTPLALADPNWLRSLSRGCWLLLAGLIRAIVLPIPAMILLGGFGVIATFLLIGVLLTGGVLETTGAQPGIVTLQRSEHKFENRRLIARATCRIVYCWPSLCSECT